VNGKEAVTRKYMVLREEAKNENDNLAAAATVAEDVSYMTG
jgi:hypothetical protein